MLRTLFFSQWVWSSLIVLALASTGLASDVGDQGTGEQLFIPSVEESSTSAENQPFNDNQATPNPTLKTNRADFAATPSRTRPTAASTHRTAVSPYRAETPGWTWGLAALGAVTVMVVPLYWVLRRKRTSPRFGVMLMSEEPPRRARASSQTFLAASLIQTQQTSDKFAEVLYTEQRKKLRRAA